MKEHMPNAVKRIHYIFKEPGPQHTDEVLHLCRDYIKEEGFRYILIATDTGRSAERALELLQGLDVKTIAVTGDPQGKMPVAYLYNHYPVSRDIKEQFQRQGKTHFPTSIDPQKKQELEARGVTVLHILDPLRIGGSLPADSEIRDIRTILDPFMPRHLRPLDIQAGADLSLLNSISRGFRVCVGITAVCAREGLVSTGEEVIAVAGTGFAGGGLDTAIALSAHPKPRHCFFRDIIAFPQNK